MKKLMILTLLVMAGLFVSAQIDNRNQLVRQIAKGDTITSRIYSTYDTYDGTNPILVNYYDSLAFVGSRGVGIGGYTLLYNKLQVNGSQYLGNTVNDTTYLQGRLGINSMGYFSNIAVVGNNTTGATKNMFNFVDGGINKIRTTYAQATDTSSFNLMFTPTGKIMFNIRGNDGKNIYYIDSLSNACYGIETPSTSTANPTQLRLGSTYSNTANQPSKCKLLIYNDGALYAGVGHTSNKMEFHTFTGSGFDFYSAAILRLSISSTGALGSFTSLTGAAIAQTWSVVNSINTIAGYNLTLSASSNTAGGTADLAGGMLTLAPGQSKNTGISSVRIQRNNRAATTGTVLNTLQDAIIIPSQNNLSDNVLKQLFEVTLPTDSAAGGHIDFTITATDGDSTQCYTGRVVYAAANFNNTVVTQITEHDAITVDSPAAMTDMTTAWTITSTAGTKIAIEVTANAGFTPARMKIYYTIHNGSMSAVTQL